MLKFKDFDYMLYDHDTGVATATYTYGRDIFIEYKNKKREDIPRLCYDLLVEGHGKKQAEVVLARNYINFTCKYIQEEREYKMNFLSTPQNYKRVFNVKT